MTLKEMIQQRLQQAFSPTQLEIIDDSHKHVGHVGSQGGGHFTVKIQADAFNNQARLAVHREIYRALDDLLLTQIHALRIKIIK